MDCVLNVIKVLNVIQDWSYIVIKVLNVIKFGPKCNKPLVLNVIKPLLHLGPNIEASNVTTVPKCNKLRVKMEQKVLS